MSVSSRKHTPFKALSVPQSVRLGSHDKAFCRSAHQAEHGEGVASCRLRCSGFLFGALLDIIQP